MTRNLLRTTRTAAVTALAVVVAAVALTSPAAAAVAGGDGAAGVRVATKVSPAVASKGWVWNNLHAGDCTMFNGTWTIHSDGTADFDGLVTSSDDPDAWIMRIDFKDARGAQIGTMTNANIQNPSDSTEFIQDMPDHNQQYRWIAHGWFDPAWFNITNGLTMRYSC